MPPRKKGHALHAKKGEILSSPFPQSAHGGPSDRKGGLPLRTCVSVENRWKKEN